MNYALLDAGDPWVTIRSDERRPYFQALERAQVESEIATFGEFLAVHIRHAADTAKASAPTSNRRRRR